MESTIDTHDREYTDADMNLYNENYLKSIKWGGPHIYDTAGILKVPTYEEIIRYRSLCLPNEVDDNTRDDVLASRRKDGMYTPLYDDEYWGTVLYNGDPEPEDVPKKRWAQEKSSQSCICASSCPQRTNL